MLTIALESWDGRKIAILRSDWVKRMKRSGGSSISIKRSSAVSSQREFHFGVRREPKAIISKGLPGGRQRPTKTEPYLSRVFKKRFFFQIKGVSSANAFGFRKKKYFQNENN